MGITTGDGSLSLLETVFYPYPAHQLRQTAPSIKAEPLQLINSKEKLTLKFDCKACEIHVMGKIKPLMVKRGLLQGG